VGTDSNGNPGNNRIKEIFLEPIEEIWLKVAKPAKDGNRYIYLKGGQDLGFLYVSGFVDIAKNGFKEWLDSFADSRQKDGSYIVSHDQWVSKKKFRFTGKIGDPFDPMALPEREYTEGEFVKLLTEKVIPNTIYSPSYIPQFLNDLRAQKRLVNGKIRLDQGAKAFLTRTVNSFPSPTRILELMVAALKEQKGSGFKSTQLSAQKSNFAAGSTAEKMIQARLAEIAKETQKAEPAPKGPTVSLKDLQKKKTPGRI